MKNGKQNPEIRLAVPADAQSIASVLAESFAEYEPLYTKKGFRATTPAAEQIRDRFNQGEIWVALLDGKIVGTVSVIPEGEALYVRSMAILPEARRNGIGQRLLTRIEDFAAENGYRKLTLSTTPFLISAIRLYEKFGFGRSNEPPHELFGTPLLRMEKCLDNFGDGRPTILANPNPDNANLMPEEISQTERTKLRRLPNRGSFDRETVYRILDEGFVCHIGFTVEDQTFVIPTGYARRGDRLLIHGSAASRMMRAMRGGIEVCVTVTLTDGLVLARSAFHHSVNYRSVVVFGAAEFISDENEKREALRAFTEHIVPGRWEEIRPPTEKELKATTVLSLPIREASAKVRAGDPVDDEEDYALDVWAGVIPLNFTAGAAENDARLKPGLAPPDYVLNYKRQSII